MILVPFGSAVHNFSIDVDETVLDFLVDCFNVGVQVTLSRGSKATFIADKVSLFPVHSAHVAPHHISQSLCSHVHQIYVGFIFSCTALM